MDGFLEKMLGPLPDSRSAHKVRWVGDPVRTHLGLLLNTRRGSLQNLPDYGLPDVSSFYSEYPASLSELRIIVEKLIKKFEPRLHNAHVRLLESDQLEFRASFLITGEIVDEDRQTQVQYRTTISSNGYTMLGSETGD